MVGQTISIFLSWVNTFSFLTYTSIRSENSLLRRSWLSLYALLRGMHHSLTRVAGRFQISCYFFSCHDQVVNVRHFQALGPIHHTALAIP